MAEKTETEALRDELARGQGREFSPGMRGQFAILPEGYEITDLEGWQDRPNRIRAHHRFVTAASLAAYVDRFAGEGTMISADADKASILAVLDGDAPGEPAHREHRAEFVARRHEVLEAWLGVSGRSLSQVELGRFLEDRAADVVVPEAADIMEMVMTFDATRKVTFRSSQRLHDGMRQFQYVEENEARGTVTLPDRLVIASPIYRGEPVERVTFMLRYRIDDGRLVFQLDMHDRDRVMRAAFERCVEGFRKALGRDLPIFEAG